MLKKILLLIACDLLASFEKKVPLFKRIQHSASLFGITINGFNSFDLAKRLATYQSNTKHYQAYQSLFSTFPSDLTDPHPLIQSYAKKNDYTLEFMQAAGLELLQILNHPKENFQE